MKKIALVTDSTADLTEEFRQKHNIHVIPLKVIFGKQEYCDGQMPSEEFYQRLQLADYLPSTSQPSPEDFRRLYSRLAEEYREIISIHISSGLSGTLNAARIAKEKIKAKIHLVDSKTISLGIGLMIEEASAALHQGMNSSQIVEKLSQARANLETLFTLNTLEYLHKGGRLGRVQSIMGSILNIKPVIRVAEDGVYHTYHKTRSQEKALQTIVEAFKKYSNGRKPVRIAVAHGAAQKAGETLKEALENIFQMSVSFYTQVGSVIGVHTGPGTVGAAIQVK